MRFPPDVTFLEAQSLLYGSRAASLQAIAGDQPAALSLSATISQYCIGGMMPESANPVQQSRTVIEIRPFKGGWQCYEGPRRRTLLDWRHGQKDAIGYATARAKFGRGEIRVLNHDGEVERVISLDQTTK